MNKITGWMCSHRIYEYKGWIFEFPAYTSPWPLKKNLELRKRAGKKFYNMIDEFVSLSKEEQEKYRIGGGCIPIG